MREIKRDQYPALHNALGFLFEDNVPLTQPDVFYLRDEWDLSRLEDFFTGLSMEGGLESELWRFVSPSDEPWRPWWKSARDCAYATSMLDSCFEGEDHDTWFNPADCRPVAVQ